MEYQDGDGGAFGVSDMMMTRNLRRLLSDADNRGRALLRQVRMLAKAKLLAGRLIPELTTMDCPPAVMGAALAIVVGTVAGHLGLEAREDFYEKFLSAARACEGVASRGAQEMRKH